MTELAVRSYSRGNAFVWLIVAGFAVWLGGFALFVAAVPDAPSEGERKTDAIVVLTGGEQRIERGLELLAAGRSKKLFISGVGRGVDIRELLRFAPSQPAGIDCCIELGHSAQDTIGNATETAEWMRREGFRSVRLVTAAYHMPRAILELGRAMPEAEIVPHPVFPEGSAAHYFAEYHKFLGSFVRPLLPQ